MCVVAEATRRRRVIELSIRRRDRRRVIGEWALHRYDGIFGTDRRGRTVNIKPKELHEAVRQTRQREKTKEFKEEYSKRDSVDHGIRQQYRRDLT
jgi:hypothetical protein